MRTTKKIPALHSIKSIVLNILCRIWALWGLCWFVFTLVPALIIYAPCFLLKDPAKARWHRHVSRVWMYIYLNLIGCPLTVKGKENFQKAVNYVIVCNHNSLLDIPVSTPFMPRAAKTIGKKSFAKVPLFGWIYQFGTVLVDRSNDASRRKSYEQMKYMLSIGLDMIIYPEGTRNRSNEPLKKFHDGAFRLAVDTGRQIIPVVIFNTAKALPVDKFFYLFPHQLEMHCLAPVDSSGMSVADLREKLFKVMWDYYSANQH
ncbi:MAG: hypothetical protein RLZZ28_991 [Bacteroidota bacterium]|jgi:1-acyl-sn-glycerol-3-phosphate acyltransferase